MLCSCRSLEAGRKSSPVKKCTWTLAQVRRTTGELGRKRLSQGCAVDVTATVERLTETSNYLLIGPKTFKVNYFRYFKDFLLPFSDVFLLVLRHDVNFCWMTTATGNTAVCFTLLLIPFGDVISLRVHILACPDFPNWNDVNALYSVCARVNDFLIQIFPSSWGHKNVA